MAGRFSVRRGLGDLPREQDAWEGVESDSDKMTPKLQRIHREMMDLVRTTKCPDALALLVRWEQLQANAMAEYAQQAAKLVEKSTAGRTTAMLTVMHGVVNAHRLMAQRVDRLLFFRR